MGQAAFNRARKKQAAEALKEEAVSLKEKVKAMAKAAQEEAPEQKEEVATEAEAAIDKATDEKPSRGRGRGRTSKVEGE